MQGPVAVAEDRPYLLEPGDQMDVKLFLHPELNENVVIRSDGKIALQLVGEVNARGVTPGALTETLMRRYTEAGLLHPQVVVILRKVVGQRVFVGGEVNAARMIPYDGRLTLTQALFEAGGLKPTAEAGSVLVLRDDGQGSPVYMTVSVTEDRLRVGSDLPLQPYDVIVVPESAIATANQFVEQYLSKMVLSWLSARLASARHGDEHYQGTKPDRGREPPEDGMKLAQWYLRKVPQYTRMARHARSVIRHATPLKVANLLRVELERKLRRVELKGLPYLLIIDPCNYCDLRCPLCPTGYGGLGRPQKMLSLEHFKQYFDPLADYLFEATMHNWGESLLNRHVSLDDRARAVAKRRHEPQHELLGGDEQRSRQPAGVRARVPDRVAGWHERGVVCPVPDPRAVRGRAEQPERDCRAQEPATSQDAGGRVAVHRNAAQRARVLRGGGSGEEDRGGPLRFILVGMPFDTVDRKATAEKWYP
jgi:polysaccharide export outer membrane protein